MIKATIKKRKIIKKVKSFQMDDNSTFPLKKEYKLIHYKQRYDWDCGISCIMMVITAVARNYFERHYEKICKEEGFGYSTWTIDLCYILKRFNLSTLYLTKTLGVDPKYANHSYYNKIINRDMDRVNLRFKEAESRGIKVDQRCISFDSIIRHIGNFGPAIVLTNAAILECENCEVIDNNDNPINEYSGHYIVICGYDLLRKKVYYRNPASDDHVCITSFDNIDKARKAFGTDEDIIFIYYKTK